MEDKLDRLQLARERSHQVGPASIGLQPQRAAAEVRLPGGNPSRNLLAPLRYGIAQDAFAAMNGAAGLLAEVRRAS